MPLAPIHENTTTTTRRFLTFPITRALVLHSVVAEDCKIYEKFTIQEYIKSRRQHGMKIISPVTRKRMGEDLVPASWAKICIERLIQQGRERSAWVASWNERVDAEMSMKRNVTGAEGGDPEAMLTIELCYYHGEFRFPKDATLDYRWLQKAHNTGAIRATADVGILLAKGTGVQQNKTEGIMYMGIAAVRGFDVACHLGLAYFVWLVVSTCQSCRSPTFTGKMVEPFLSLPSLDRRQSKQSARDVAVAYLQNSGLLCESSNKSSSDKTSGQQILTARCRSLTLSTT